MPVVSGSAGRSWPAFCDGLMNTAPGSIVRRFPAYWFDSEGGIDWNPGTNNDIIALADGEIEGAGYFCHDPYNLFMPGPFPCNNPDYGVVTTRVRGTDGRYTSLYYQHINIAPGIILTNKGGVGQRVKKGDIIGTTNPGGFIEMGVNVQDSWFGIWGRTPAPGAHIDPEAYLRALISNYGTSNTNGVPFTGTGSGSFDPNILNFGGSGILQTVNSIGNTVHDTLNTVPGFVGIVEALDQIEQFQPLVLQGTMGGPDLSILGLPNFSDLSKVIQSVTVPANTIQSVLVFVTANIAAAFIRLILIFIGIVIFVGLIQNMLQHTGVEPSDLLSIAGLAA